MLEFILSMTLMFWGFCFYLFFSLGIFQVQFFGSTNQQRDGQTTDRIEGEHSFHVWRTNECEVYSAWILNNTPCVHNNHIIKHSC